jgi:hypothetical protein
MGSVDISAHNKKEAKVMQMHQMIFPKPPNSAHMKHLPCKLCEEAESAENRLVGSPFPMLWLSNIISREFRDDKKVALKSERMRSAPPRIAKIQRRQITVPRQRKSSRSISWHRSSRYLIKKLCCTIRFLSKDLKDHNNL